MCPSSDNVKFHRATLFKTFLELQIIVPRYNGFHSMPGLSFHNSDDHKMVFHTWRIQNAVEKTYVLLNNLGSFNNYSNESHFQCSFKLRHEFFNIPTRLTCQL